MAGPPSAGKPSRPGASAAWREARRILKAHRGRLLLSAGLMLVGRLATLVLPVSTKFLVDDVIGRGRAGLLAPLAAVVAFAALVHAAAGFLLSQTLGVAAQRSIMNMRKSLHAHVTRLPVGFFDSQKVGALIARILSDAEGLRNLLGTGLVQLCGSLLTALLALGVLFHLNWRMTLLTLLVMGLFSGIIVLGFRWLRPLYRERAELYAQLSGRLTEALGGIRIVKAYTAEPREERVFARGVHRLFRSIARQITTISAVGSVSGAIFGVVAAVVLWAGGRAILSGSMTLGDLVMYVFLTGLVVLPVAQIAEISTQLGESFAGLDRIRELMRMTTEQEEDEGREPIGRILGHVEVQDVSFEYTAEIPVLKNISFVAPAGSTTALVGSSGSGKSTLLSLVMAFNRPRSGRILVDGRDLTRIRLREYRAQLGVVLQDNVLFDGTIAENIAYARPRAEREEILAVSRIAHCDEFVERLAQKYDTVVGERGVRLSGGQRQRIAIARAILADATILILDEATSSLDSASEALIQDGLRSLRRGRTTFVIAHRLSTIRSAQQILVLEGGEIVERGTHKELMARGGRYRELHDQQYQLERDQFVNPGEDLTPEPVEPGPQPQHEEPPERALPLPRTPGRRDPL